jgi:hypothetical protein
MSADKLLRQLESQRKFREYEMKLVKMAGYLTDYYIDRAIESDDFSYISSFLIDYFSGIIGKPVDVYYLVSKYKEFDLNQKIEDIDFDINEWYRLKYENDRIDPIKQAPEIFGDEIVGMSDEEYVAYMIEQRKNHYGE